MSSQEGEPGRRIMLVDDDGVCLAVVGKALRKRGFQVCPYSDPRQALDNIAVDLPAAVITDMRMPHMNGLDVVREVQERLGQDAPPVLVISVDDEEKLLEEAFRLGAVDYLLKPVNEVELGVKLDRALRPKPDEAKRGWPALPERIGDWTLIDCIGRGGTACVFTAVRDGSETPCALKVMWPHLTGSTEALLRFRREIDTLAALEHPGLVAFVASGRHEDHYYYVMSFLPGGTLRRRIQQRGPGTPEEALQMLEQAAGPLGYLHTKGIVHRDVKPGNLFYDERGRVVLGDFGLARRLQDHGITLEHDFIGTPLYLAPEVFSSADFDQSVDFYALGVCAYELLLGRPPLDGPCDTVSLIGRIMDHGLPKPSHLLPDLPGPMLALLEALLGPSEGRPRSADELVAAVARTRAAL